jgi:hypothetical protein
MHGLKQTDVMEVCESVMSNSGLDCSQSADMIQDKLFNRSPLTEYGIYSRKACLSLVREFGSIDKMIEHVLLSVGYVECCPCLGSVGFVEGSCAVHISNDVYAHKSPYGVNYTKQLNLRNWKCQT